MVAVTANTSTDSSLIQRAGVAAGEKMVVGLIVVGFGGSRRRQCAAHGVVEADTGDARVDLGVEALEARASQIRLGVEQLDAGGGTVLVGDAAHAVGLLGVVEP